MLLARAFFFLCSNPKAMRPAKMSALPIFLSTWIILDLGMRCYLANYLPNGLAG